MKIVPEIYQGEDGRWYWRLWLDDEIVATGHQGFEHRVLADAEFKAVAAAFKLV